MKYLTVNIPVYNDIKLLKRMLDSLSNARKNDVAIIHIVSDCDDISDEEYTELFSKYNLDIHFDRNKKNIGVGATRKKCWDETTTEWLSFVDQDDYVSKNYFERFMDAYNNHSGKMMFVFSKKNMGEPLDGGIETNSCIHVGGNFYHRDLLKKYDLRMSENRMADDIFLNTILGLYLSPVYNFMQIYDDKDYIYT